MLSKTDILRAAKKGMKRFMPHLTDHIQILLNNINVPNEAAAAFAAVESRLDSDKAFSERFDKVVYDYMFDDLIMDEALESLRKIAADFGENVYTLNFVFLLNNTEELLNRYRQEGVSDEIYWNTMDDLRCKLLECMECEGVPGIFVPSWYNGFFRMSRFALGRFQYEVSIFKHEGGYTTKSGHFLKDGSDIINFHIPSSGVSLTDEVRFDSYKRAFNFYKHMFGGDKIVMCCNSWLLYPEQEKFLPENSNILRFLRDFEIVFSKTKDDFGDAWRIFGRHADLPPEKLPRDTALRKAYADWILAGNSTGAGYGVIVFDGENIIT